MDRQTVNEMGATLHAIRAYAGQDMVIVSIGARGPNLDCPAGNLIATIRRGDDEATAEAKYLADCISLASAKIDRDRKAREDAKKKVKAA